MDITPCAAFVGSCVFVLWTRGMRCDCELRMVELPSAHFCPVQPRKNHAILATDISYEQVFSPTFGELLKYLLFCLIFQPLFARNVLPQHFQEGKRCMLEQKRKIDGVYFHFTKSI